LIVNYTNEQNGTGTLVGTMKKKVFLANYRSVGTPQVARFSSTRPKRRLAVQIHSLLMSSITFFPPSIVPFPTAATKEITKMRGLAKCILHETYQLLLQECMSHE
jgi:hypothetical protein